MSEIQSFSEIEQLWATRADFARAISDGYDKAVSQEVVRKWSLRGKIPSSYWVRVVRACHEIDKAVTFKLLAELADVDRKHKKALETRRRAQG